jgi:formylglycine-generating enzyme required for sulfatase activity
VGQLLPNEFGLFDVLGNAWEWCHDGPAGCFDEVPMPGYPRGSREQPAPDPGHLEAVLYNASKVGKGETWRILRGGCFIYSPTRARSAHRDWIGSLERRASIGFRVVRSLPRPPREPATPRLAARPPEASPPPQPIREVHSHHARQRP